MEWIDTYHQDAEPPYHFVFSERDEGTGEHTMLAMSEDGWSSSRWVREQYDPNGDNEHLGQRIDRQQLIGKTVLDAFFSRLSIPEEWEALYQEIERSRGEDHQ